MLCRCEWGKEKARLLTRDWVGVTEIRTLLFMAYALRAISMPFWSILTLIVLSRRPLTIF